MDSQKQQLIERLQGATNILVTVNSNPTVDQLAACIGLTLLLNEAGKRATAVYSGETPSTIQFLQPQATLEKTTDSLRDFIISLDIAKADKLRYKKDGPVVKIFITPYKTSLSSDDLVFEQGDFNIDVVVGLGVHSQEDLDQAITMHGRILHDATVMTINNTPNGELGSINWQDLAASSLSEQVASLATAFEKVTLDEQISTALLTGIVAETERFSNNRTSATTMSLAASLMAAGANQQLVAAELEKPEPEAEPIAETPKAEPAEDAPAANDDGLVFTNDHTDEAEPAPVDTIHINDDGHFSLPDAPSDDYADNNMIMSPPASGATFTASGQADTLDPAVDPLSQSLPDGPMLDHQNFVLPNAQPPVDDNGAPAFPAAPAEIEPELTLPPRPPQPDTPQISHHGSETLDQIEYASRAQEEADDAARPDTDSARDAVSDAISTSVNQPLEPIAALNAQPFGELVNPALPPSDSQPVNNAVADHMQGNPQPTAYLAETPTMDMPLPQVMPPQSNAAQPLPAAPNSPPQVPPPFMPGSNL